MKRIARLLNMFMLADELCRAAKQGLARISELGDQAESVACRSQENLIAKPREVWHPSLIDQSIFWEINLMCRQRG